MRLEPGIAKILGHAQQSLLDLQPKRRVLACDAAKGAFKAGREDEFTHGSSAPQAGDDVLDGSGFQLAASEVPEGFCSLGSRVRAPVFDSASAQEFLKHGPLFGGQGFSVG
jgi:hypothetical protein